MLPGGARFVSVSMDKTTKLWTFDGALERTFEVGSYVYCVAALPDGVHFVVGTSNDEVRLYHVDGTPPHRRPPAADTARRRAAPPASCSGSRPRPKRSAAESCRSAAPALATGPRGTSARTRGGRGRRTTGNARRRAARPDRAGTPSGCRSGRTKICIRRRASSSRPALLEEAAASRRRRTSGRGTAGAGGAARAAVAEGAAASSPRSRRRPWRCCRRGRRAAELRAWRQSDFLGDAAGEGERREK